VDDAAGLNAAEYLGFSGHLGAPYNLMDFGEYYQTVVRSDA